jgi:GT2 family glycosyltransferase/exopolysaccharide biosynthesis predicted pyruvyltransferase EpsI
LLGVEHSAGVQRSREHLLEVIGDNRKLTLVRGLGNVGDELIRAGTERLLEAHPFDEIGLDDLPGSSGDTVLLPGSGAFCRPYHEWMPRALAIAELRFDRVIVLPSSFDVGEDSVRDALRRTSATIFAREPESLRRIEGLCRARLAHDCAFFFDFSRFEAPGKGTLNAFRTDREATTGELMLDDNDDISVTAPSLKAWLAKIERYAVVRTDRAHVMIAAALMGREVEFAPSSYHKLEALAASSLRGFRVRQIEPPRRRHAGCAPISDQVVGMRRRLQAAAGPPPAADHAAVGPARLTAVILTRDRLALVARCVRSVTAATVPVRVLLIDNNSDPRGRPALEALAAADQRIELRLADRNLGCAGGRRLAVDLVDTELLLFLDDDAELIDGALEHMLADLDAHPDAAGVTALVVGPHGNVQHYGGWIAVSEQTARFTLDGAGLRFDHPSLPPTGPSGWAPGTAALLRTQVLREVALDERMSTYYEDNDWCHRVEQRRPGRFRRCREALVLHHHDYAASCPSPSRLVACYERVQLLAAQAHFFHANGVLLDVDLGSILPELRRPDSGTDLAAARLLMELIAARGVDWTVMEWINGGLQPLLDGAHTESAQRGAQITQLLDERGAREARIGQLEADAAALQARVEALAHEQAQAAEQQTQAAEQLAQAGEQLAWLQARHLTLCRIEAGGWWRLRSQLMPVLRVASRIRRMLNERM